MICVWISMGFRYLIRVYMTRERKGYVRQLLTWQVPTVAILRCSVFVPRTQTAQTKWRRYHHVSSLPFILLLLLRAQHQLRPYILVKVFLAQRFQLHRALLQRQPLLMRILRHFRRHIIPNDRIQARHEHKTNYGVSWSRSCIRKTTYLSCRRLPILFSSAFSPSTRFLSKLLIASLKIRILCSRFRIITGLKTLSSNCPFIPPTVTAV